MPPAKKPGVRLAKYDKLIARLYEVLMLGFFVKKVHGPHITVPHDLSTTAGARRRFLQNLAFLCDYVKGGSSTTAICVEERHDCYVAWVASNEETPPKVVVFLESILEALRTASSDEERRNLKVHLLRDAPRFAQDRVFKEWKLLVRSASLALATLNQVGDEGTDLIPWLEQFRIRRGQTPASICQLAYDIRQSKQMKAIELRHKLFEDYSFKACFKPLEQVAHFVGRLAARVRAVNQLVDDAARLDQCLSNPWLVHVIPAPEPAPVPEPDRLTQLPGILKRMMEADDPAYQRLLTCFESLDRSCWIMGGILSKHAGGENSLKPIVHGEVKVIDYFHDQRLAFWEDDAYVACSKPACLLCRLYMKYHPIPFVETDSHNKIPSNWCPALLQAGAQDPRFTEHRKVLTAIIRDVRVPILKQMGTLRCSSTFHPDSLDQITQLEADPFDRLNTDSGYLTDFERNDDSEVYGSSSAPDDASDSDSDGGAPL